MPEEVLACLRMFSREDESDSVITAVTPVGASVGSGVGVASAAAFWTYFSDMYPVSPPDSTLPQFPLTASSVSCVPWVSSASCVEEDVASARRLSVSVVSFSVTCTTSPAENSAVGVVESLMSVDPVPLPSESFFSVVPG